MKTKTFLKQIIAIIAIALTIVMLSVGKSNAALQANQNTQYTKTDNPGNWMNNFRQMETTGGAMGLSETLNSDLTGSSDSNNIDVHMMRTTEYGAIAILSASGYGNPSNNNAMTTTTGNSTGIMLNTNNNIWEWTAGGLSGSIFGGVNSRYYESYTTSDASAKIGDALGTSSTTNPGCTRWHSASYSYWVYGDYAYFKRGNGGVFSFYSNDARDSNYCRGVAVCGAGL